MADCFSSGNKNKKPFSVTLGSKQRTKGLLLLAHHLSQNKNQAHKRVVQFAGFRVQRRQSLLQEKLDL